MASPRDKRDGYFGGCENRVGISKLQNCVKIGRRRNKVKGLYMLRTVE